MMATLFGIAIKPQRLQPMYLLAEAELSTTLGIVGDSRGMPCPRHVTLLSQTAWRAACHEIQLDLPWTARRANLLVDNLDLFQSAGSRILIGDTVLEITGECDPCSRMDAEQPGLFQVLKPDWRGGVCCRVLQGGRLTVGVEVMLVNQNAQTPR